jgi:hypothetical protein
VAPRELETRRAEPEKHGRRTSSRAQWRNAEPRTYAGAPTDTTTSPTSARQRGPGRAGAIDRSLPLAPAATDTHRRRVSPAYRLLPPQVPPAGDSYAYGRFAIADTVSPAWERTNLSDGDGVISLPTIVVIRVVVVASFPC